MNRSHLKPQTNDALVTPFCVHLDFSGEMLYTGETGAHYLCLKKKGKEKVKITVFQGARPAFSCPPAFDNKPKYCAFCVFFLHFCSKILQKRAKNPLKKEIWAYQNIQQCCPKFLTFSKNVEIASKQLRLSGVKTSLTFILANAVVAFCFSLNNLNQQKRRRKRLHCRKKVLLF